MRDEPHDLVAAYALDAVDDVERRRFEKHLATCASCRNELEHLRDAAASLSVPSSTAPPAHLRDEILRAVATDAETREATRPVSRPSRRLFLTGAAATVVGVGGVGLWRNRRDEQPVTAQDILDDETSQKSRTTYAGSTVTVARNSKGQGAIRFEPALAPATGHAYTMWTGSTPNHMVNSGQFDRDGRQSTMLLNADMREVRIVAATLEKAGTTPRQPTSDPVLTIHLT